MAVAVGDTGGTADPDPPVGLDTGSGPAPHPASTTTARTVAHRVTWTMTRR